MIDRVIIAHYYQPSTAATNRIIAYAKGFARANREVFLILGRENHETLPVIDGVQVVGVDVKCHRDLYRRMASVVKMYYLPTRCSILVYGSPILCWYLPSSKYNIFYECTEIPFYGRNKTLISRIKETIKITVAKRATGMLVISQALRQYFISRGLRNIEVVNMFVDVERFAGATPSIVGTKYIAYCGTISPFKDGVDILIKSFAQFHIDHNDYQLKLIGRFENKEAETYLKSLIDEYHLADSVSFTGMVSPPNMPVLLSGAQMLVLARPNNEQAKYGFPTKLGEYLATGVPVVVTDVGEIGLFLKDGVNCCLAKPGDVKDFAEKMSWVAENEDASLAMGTNGKILTSTAFSCYKECEKVLLFMEKCIN